MNGSEPEGLPEAAERRLRLKTVFWRRDCPAEQIEKKVKRHASQKERAK